MHAHTVMRIWVGVLGYTQQVPHKASFQLLLQQNQAQGAGTSASTGWDEGIEKREKSNKRQDGLDPQLPIRNTQLSV